MLFSWFSNVKKHSFLYLKKRDRESKKNRCFFPWLDRTQFDDRQRKSSQDIAIESRRAIFLKMGLSYSCPICMLWVHFQGFWEFHWRNRKKKKEKEWMLAGIQTLLPFSFYFLIVNRLLSYFFSLFFCHFLPFFVFFVLFLFLFEKFELVS